MTVKELIEKLKHFDPNMRVEMLVKTKTYPVKSVDTNPFPQSDHYGRVILRPWKPAF